MKTRLTEEQRSYFITEINRIKEYLPHEISDIESKDLYWTDGSGLMSKVFGGTLASFDWKNPQEIIISDSGILMPEMLVSTVAHELHHAWQFEEYGVMYTFMAIPVIRQKLLEKTAIEVEKAADKAMGMEGLRDGDKDKSGL